MNKDVLSPNITPSSRDSIFALFAWFFYGSTSPLHYHIYPFCNKTTSINLFSHDVHSIQNTIMHHLNAKQGKREDENELKPQNDLLMCTEQFLSVTNQMNREVCGRNDIHRARHIVYFSIFLIWTTALMYSFTELRFQLLPDYCEQTKKEIPLNHHRCDSLTIASPLFNLRAFIYPQSPASDATEALEMNLWTRRTNKAASINGDTK